MEKRIDCTRSDGKSAKTGEILFIQIIGNVNDVVSAERTVTEELNREPNEN
jgi:nicotinate-nucleotide pyrophosphorylase